MISQAYEHDDHLLIINGAHLILWAEQQK